MNGQSIINSVNKSNKCMQVTTIFNITILKNHTYLSEHRTLHNYIINWNTNPNKSKKFSATNLNSFWNIYTHKNSETYFNTHKDHCSNLKYTLEHPI